MNINLKFSINIIRENYPNLTKAEITHIIKEMEQNGSIIDYILSECESALEMVDFDK